MEASTRFLKKVRPCGKLWGFPTSDLQGPCMKLGKWGLNHNDNPKKLKVPGTWSLRDGQLKGGRKASPTDRHVGSNQWSPRSGLPRVLGISHHGTTSPDSGPLLTLLTWGFAVVSPLSSLPLAPFCLLRTRGFPLLYGKCGFFYS